MDVVLGLTYRRASAGGTFWASVRRSGKSAQWVDLISIYISYDMYVAGILPCFFRPAHLIKNL
jgi:hypothetical protein